MSSEGPSWPQEGPRLPKMAPRQAQDGPRQAQDGPRQAQDGPKQAQNIAWNTPKLAKDRPNPLERLQHVKLSSEIAFWPPGRPKTAEDDSRWPKMAAAKTVQDSPKSIEKFHSRQFLGDGSRPQRQKPKNSQNERARSQLLGRAMEIQDGPGWPKMAPTKTSE